MLDVATGKVTARLGGEYRTAHHFAFADGGKKLVTDQVAWDVATGKVAVSAAEGAVLVSPEFAVSVTDRTDQPRASESFVIRVLTTLGAILAASLASAQSPADADLPGRAKDIFRSHCLECHYAPVGARKPKAGLDILGLAKLTAGKQLSPGKPDDSELFHRMTTADGGRTPPAPAAALTPAEIDTVRPRIAAGAKPFPADVPAPDEQKKEDAFARVKGVEYVHRQILAHVETLAERDVPFIRYFSANHLLTSGASRQRLDLYRDVLAKAVNHLSMEPDIASLITVDALTASIFAVDIPKIGWSKKPFQLSRNGKSRAPAT